MAGDADLLPKLYAEIATQGQKERKRRWSDAAARKCLEACSAQAIAATAAGWCDAPAGRSCRA